MTVRRVESLSPRLVQVTLGGDELAGLSIDEPAASVRLLLPTEAGGPLVVPQWNGNEFLLPDGRRPTIRTFTPRRLDADAVELDLQIVVHGSGAASTWASTAEPGAAAAISGPGRGYVVDTEAAAFLLAGDETAVPAISQLLEVLPPSATVDVAVEVADPAARVTLPDHPRLRAEWCDLPAGAPVGEALFDAVRGTEVPPEARVWAAGEAAAVQRIRRHLFDDRGLPRAAATIRGYWKHGRRGDG